VTTSNQVTVPIPWQAPGTSVTYNADSLATVANLTAGTFNGLNSNTTNGGGSAVTLGTDTDGNLNQVAYSFATPTTAFTYAHTVTTNTALAGVVDSVALVSGTGAE
jgi:hypothetical protein